MKALVPASAASPSTTSRSCAPRVRAPPAARRRWCCAPGGGGGQFARVGRLHISMTHTSHTAMAIVVAEHLDAGRAHP